MKNKGFTLIELLAVIVILAIIALIATPVIMGIINSAGQDARNRSAELMVSAVELAYQTSYAQKGSEPSLAEVMDKVYANGVSKATVDKTAKTITSTDGKVVCTVGGTTTLTVTCTGSNEDANLTIPTMTLGS